MQRRRDVTRASDGTWPAWYRLRISGVLDGHWSAQLGGVTISHTPTGDTVLEGEIADLAALYGLIGRLRDLGVTLIAVQRTERGDTPA